MAKENYTIVDKNGKSESYDSGRKAGEAFKKASYEDKVSVIKSTEAKGAVILASTVERKSSVTGKNHYTKYMNSKDKEFRDGWKKNDPVLQKQKEPTKERER